MKIKKISGWHDKKRARHPILWTIEIFLLPFLSGGCVLLGTFWLWKTASRQETIKIKDKIEIAAETLKKQVEAELDTPIVGLKQMAKWWEKDGPPIQREWRAGARAYMDLYPVSQTLQWVNTSFQPRWIVAPDENVTPDRELHQKVLANYKTTQQEAIIIQSPQNSKDLWVYVPLVYQKWQYGFLFAIYPTENLVKNILQKNTLPDYGIRVFDGDREIFIHHQDEGKNPTIWKKEITFSWRGMNWRSQIWPSHQLLAKEQSQLPEVILTTGIILSIAVALSVYNAQKVRRQAKENELIYLDLNQEISEREEVEAALRQNLQIIDLADDAIIILDLEDLVVYWNQGAEKLYGWKKEEVIGKYIHKFLQTLFSQPLEEIKKECLQKGYWQGELIQTKRDGTQITVASRWRLQRDKKSQPKAFLQINHDITDRKRTEEIFHQSQWQLREQTAQLEAAFQELKNTQSQLIQSEKMSSLGQMVAGVAHEINNPVNFIYGNIVHAKEYTEDLLKLMQLYQKEYPNPTETIQDEIEAIDLEFLIRDLPKVLASIKVGAERIREIVKSLRHFSRLDEAERKEVDIHEGIDSTLMILQSRLKDKSEHSGIQIIREYGKLPLVECYAGQLNQVFMNLICNAIDALDEYNKMRSLEEICANPSTIKIKTQIKPCQPEKESLFSANFQPIVPSVQIWIADNGHGITEEVRQRLFDPFFTTKPIGKGTGLGLAISYQIVVEKHGGKLECYSKPGDGAEFLIEIPLRQEVSRDVADIVSTRVPGNAPLISGDVY